MDNLEQIFVDILLILSCFAAGWLGQVAKHRALRRDALDFDYRLSDLEGRVGREVKIRAGQAGQKALTEDKALLEWAKEQVQAPTPTTGPTLKPLHEWRRDKMVGPK